MRQVYGVSCGIWEIKQDRESLEVKILKYGDPVSVWIENKALTWAEMYEILARESKERSEGK